MPDERTAYYRRTPVLSIRNAIKNSNFREKEYSYVQRTSRISTGSYVSCARLYLIYIYILARTHSWPWYTRVRRIAHEYAQQRADNTCAARNQHTDTVRRLRIVLRGGAPANCALYTIVALRRLTPIDLLSLYKVTQNNVINYQSCSHC